MLYSLPKYYFRDIPEYVMDEIINGMIEGKRSRHPKKGRRQRDCIRRA